jgi:hypothetical protein
LKGLRFTAINGMDGINEIAGGIGLPMEGFFSGYAGEAINAAYELISAWRRKKAALSSPLCLGAICGRFPCSCMDACNPAG